MGITPENSLLSNMDLLLIKQGLIEKHVDDTLKLELDERNIGARVQHYKADIICKAQLYQVVSWISRL